MAAAREVLRGAFAAAAVPPQWSEHLSSEAPAHARGLGSPTILVDGRDVSGDAGPGPQVCCRLYATTDGRLAGVPEVDVVARVLRMAAAPEQEGSR